MLSFFSVCFAVILFLDYIINICLMVSISLLFSFHFSSLLFAVLIQYDLSSSSLILFFCLIKLLNYCSGVCNSVIIFFSYKISIWFLFSVPLSLSIFSFCLLFILLTLVIYLHSLLAQRIFTRIILNFSSGNL